MDGLEIQGKNSNISIVEKLLSKLHTLADAKFCIFSKKIVNSSTDMLGIQVPKLRKIAKDLLAEFALEEILTLPDNRYIELDYIKGFCVCYSQSDLTIKQILLADLSKKWDNWAVCDSTAASLKIKKNEENQFYDFCEEIINAEYVYSIRFGVVSLLDHFVCDKYFERLICTIKKVPQGKHYYIDMALAWLISVMIIKMYDKTTQFLIASKCAFSEFVYNKSLQKARESLRISESQKIFLKSLKK